MAKLISTALPDLLPVYRHPGLHVSDIIHYICIKRGIYREGMPKNKTRLELGLTFEWALKERYHESDPTRYISDFTVRKNGIWLSPDIADTHDSAVMEIKVTWMSTKDKDFECDDYWKYIVQLIAYCSALEYVVGRLLVCHVNGNYRWGEEGGAEPTAPQYEERFSRKVLASNWEMLLANANDAAEYKAQKEIT